MNDFSSATRKGSYTTQYWKMIENAKNISMILKMIQQNNSDIGTTIANIVGCIDRMV